jgi:hypothetical protein
MKGYRISKATVYRYLQGVRPTQPEDLAESM